MNKYRYLATGQNVSLTKLEMKAKSQFRNKILDRNNRILETEEKSARFLEYIYTKNKNKKEKLQAKLNDLKMQNDEYEKKYSAQMN